MTDNRKKIRIATKIHEDLYEEHTLEVILACRRCTLTRDEFRNVQAALEAGWRSVKPDTPSPRQTWTHVGICLICRDHPENSIHEEAA